MLRDDAPGVLSGAAGMFRAPCQPRVAIVHYWLVGMRGGEKVIEALCEMFPDADIYTHVYRPERISARIRRHRIRTSFIARLPFAGRLYTYYLPLMPSALEQFDLRGYDLVISSESGPAKGVLTGPDTLHVCYCHTPMRYVWSGYQDYREKSHPALRAVMSLLLHRLRQWDLASSFRVDHFIANSRNVADRIGKYYRREAAVMYPPVELGEHDPTIAPEDFYLFVSQLVPYKGADVAIEAFNRLGRRLVVIGHGSEQHRLRRLAGPTITMLGWQDDAAVRDHYARCRALIFVADEDFGMVPVEAMSVGRPVIALRRGGALETVVPDETGLFFDEATPEALTEAVERFELIEHRFDPARIAAHVRSFSRDAFKAQMAAYLRHCAETARHRRDPPQEAHWPRGAQPFVPARQPTAAA
jgi:glycosyltransferase involved in cell wall biosynthesis